MDPSLTLRVLIYGSLAYASGFDFAFVNWQNCADSITIMTTSQSTAGRTDDVLIEAQQLHVTFDSQKVLRDISLAVPRGQTIAIIGESGCGKTVLMKSLIGLVRPIQGKVVFDGHNLAELNDKQISKQRIRFGFVFQGSALFDSMTIGQNVAFPLHQHTQKTDAEIRDIVLMRLADVGLPEEVIVKKPAELSGGMRKRVGLARALAMDPEILLYDEPTTGLDPIMSDVISELIVQTRDRSIESHKRVTSIVVTHDMRAAQKVADRVVMLYPLTRLDENESQIVYDGSPQGIHDAPDQRVGQFVRGEAGQRLTEMRQRTEEMAAAGS